MARREQQIVIIGAGPAGLTAAYELSRYGRTGTIVEADSVVGGIARTVERDGYRFDLGGHRFFTKVAEIERLWEEMLREPMLERRRLSRIFYGGKFYDYPLKATNALRNMGLWNAGMCMLSYGRARLRPIREPANVEQWVTNRFGARVFNMFFKSYAEKMWGRPCTEIGADWAAQRIKGLNLGTAVRNALFGTKKDGRIFRTTADDFRYPRHGPGQLWEACASTLRERGWTIRMGTRVVEIEQDLGEDGVCAVSVRSRGGFVERLPATQVFSSMALRDLLLCMTPPPPRAVVEAASKLAYRDFLTVALVLDKPDLWPDTSIYVHSPEVRVARIQNFGNWSPGLLADPKTSCLGLEYFVFEGDELWSSKDEDLVRLAYEELRRINLAGGKLVKGYVVRIPKAYPVYDPGYEERLGRIRHWLATVNNLHCIGRNGQHRCNNQDHSMATALIAARSVALAQERDPWAVNEDAGYQEIAKTERAAPMTPAGGGRRSARSGVAADGRFPGEAALRALGPEDFPPGAEPGDATRHDAACHPGHRVRCGDSGQDGEPKPDRERDDRAPAAGGGSIR